MLSPALARILTATVIAVIALRPPEGQAEPWTETTPIPGISLNGVAFLSSTVVVAVGDVDGGSNYTILLSTNGGVTWNPATTPNPGAGENLNDVAFNGANGVAVGDAGKILYSSDSGATWSDVSDPSRTLPLNAVAMSGVIAVAVGNAKTTMAPPTRFFSVLQSGDSGANWAAVPMANFPGALSEEHLLDVIFVNATTLVAVGERQGPNPTLIRSSNSGLSWTDAITLNNAPNRDLNSLAVNGSTVMAVGDKSGNSVTMYRSTDSGSTWDVPASFPSGAPNNRALTEVIFVGSGTMLAVGDEKVGKRGVSHTAQHRQRPELGRADPPGRQ